MTKITIEIDTDDMKSIKDARNIIKTLLGGSFDVIEYGDREPPSNTRWKDADGDEWCSDAYGGWRYTNSTYPTAWTEINNQYFPMTRVED